MVKFQAAPRTTPPTLRRDVATLPAIAQEYCARHRCWTATPWLEHLLPNGRRLARRCLCRLLLGTTLNAGSQPRLRRQATHQIAHVRSRKARGEQLLNLAHTPMLAQLEQLRGILQGQMLAQQTQRRSVQRAARHPSEQLRMIAAHPRRRDVPTRRRLTQPEPLHAILEQRRKPETEKQLPLVQLRQVRQKLRRDLIASPHDARQLRQEFVVRQ